MPKQDYIERMVVHSGLDGEVLPGKTLVEIIGTSRALIEYHQGLLCYSNEKVIIKGYTGKISVSGTGLKIAHMSKQQMMIYGNIEAVVLCKECS